jgi:Tol biopolymer transport system component
MPAQGALSAALASPWKQVGKQIEFKERTMRHTMSPDGKVAAWISSKACSDCNQDIVLRDVLTGREQRITPLTSPESKKYGWQDVQSLLFSTDSTLLAAAISLAGNETSRIDLYDIRSGRRVKEFRYRMRSTVLHDNCITEFAGNRIKVVDEFYGIYTIEDGKVTSFVETKVDFLEEPHDEMGDLRIWTTPEYKNALFSTSILHIGAGSGKQLSLRPGSTITDMKILPEKTSFLTCEIGGPKYPAPGIMTVEGGGAAYCRDAREGRVLYKLADLSGMLGSIDLSNDRKTLMLVDRNFGDVNIRFFRR